ncbi:MAG: hypothetical protein KDD73_00680 [Anaerolineales bacterium]|nr:hypothetical protein [Anaerolineales bacterium]MCB9128423.1 hypothetical protein [Ardenticatenales bacterium]
MSAILGFAFALIAFTVAGILLFAVLVLPGMIQKWGPALQADSAAAAPVTHPPASIPISRLIPQMALFVLPGIPLVAFIWHTLNRTLSLHFENSMLFTVPFILLIFFALLVFLARRVMAWTGL